MSTETLNILNAALALPEAARLEIAHRILESVKPATALGEDDADFAAELGRRISRYQSGETEAAPWEVVRERIRSRLDAGN